MAEEFKLLSDIEHVLKRPSMYIGSTSLEEIETFIDGKLQKIKIVQGLEKIISEIIDNTIDEAIRSKTTKMKIDITMNDKMVIVKDSGRGIPVIKHKETGLYLPELAWTKLRAGTSFEDNRTGPSQNGIGSSLTAIFSVKFIGETYDGSNYCKITATNNLKNVDCYVVNKKQKSGTTVTFWPDFSRFECDGISTDLQMVIKERLKVIGSVFPELIITFNEENLKPRNYKAYLKTFSEVFVDYSVDGKYYFGIFNSPYDEFKQTSNINSLDIHLGGTHEEQIMLGVSYALKDLIKKKHKIEMAPAEIKRGLLLVFGGRDFKGMKFDSQTKQRLTNSVAETKEYLEYADIPFDKIAKKILATPELIDPILQAKLAKQAAIEAALVTKAQKKLAGAKVKKHIQANSKNPRERQLFICEGDSAIGRLKEVRDVKTMGGFPIRGKMLNTFGMKEKDILDNKECKELMTILGLKFGTNDQETLSNLTYHKINIFSDSDYDGYHIRTLVINFLSRWPVLFTKKMVNIVVSPIIILENGKKKEFLYSLNDYKTSIDKWKGWKVRYVKGLGGLSSAEYEMVINNPDSYFPIKIDDPQYLEIMFDGNATEKRKEFLRGE